MNIYEGLLENREYKELGRLLARLDLDNNKQKTVAVNHGKLSGLLDDDHTQYFLANGARELSGNLIPSLSDTYDIGSSTKLLRKGWLSELDTVLFAKNTVTLLGGWFLVSKDEGIIAADIEASYSIIEFDKAMTENDIVLLRAAGKVEYVKIGTNVFQYTYNVTRDLDGSGANDWAKGTPFVVLGQAGDGRIELNAYDTPRIQLLKQGSTYNAQTEIIRIGDLNGNWGYSSQKWGVAIGEYASNKPNILIDEDGNLKFRLYSTDVMAFANGNADISGKLRMPGTNSAIAIGSTPPTASNAGTGIWLDRTGLYSLNANEYQVKIDATDGKLYAGKGEVVLGEDGLSLSYYEILTADGAKINWYDNLVDKNLVSRIYSSYDSTAGGASELSLQSFKNAGNTWDYPSIKLWAINNADGHLRASVTVSAGTIPEIFLYAYDDTLNSAINIKYNSLEFVGIVGSWIKWTNNTSPVYVSSNSIKFNGIDLTSIFIRGTKIRFLQGGVTKYFYVSSSSFSTNTTVVLDAGDTGTTVHATDAISQFEYSHQAAVDSIPFGSSTFVPLSSRLTSTSWDGDARSTTAKTKIDLSAVFGVPAGIKAVYARIQANDSGSANNPNLYVLLSPNDTSGHASLVVRPAGLPNDYVADQVGIVPCDANGDIYYQIAASGTGTMDVNIQIWGYFM